jgi:hypothetical protein
LAGSPASRVSFRHSYSRCLLSSVGERAIAPAAGDPAPGSHRNARELDTFGTSSVCFEQDAVRDLDWPRLKVSPARTDPNVIDVHSLENCGQSAQFFFTEVSHRLVAGEDAPFLWWV